MKNGKMENYLLDKKIGKLVVFLMVLLLFFCRQDMAIANLPGLHVDGSKILDASGNEIILKIICHVDYMEASYKLRGNYITTEQEFNDRLSWILTQDDFYIIKSMGFTAVRVSCGERHFAGEMARIKQLIEWAKNANLYLIICWAVPPGGVADNGYYSDAPFWDEIRSRGIADSFLAQNFFSKWRNLCQLVAPYPHVLLEPFNEPQLDPSKTASDSSLYAMMIERLAELMPGNSTLLVVGGLNYSAPNFINFKWLNFIDRSIPNLVAAAHYYMEDFVYQGCAWDIPSAHHYRNKPRPFRDTAPERQVCSFPFARTDILALTEKNGRSYSADTANPVVGLTSVTQPGSYEIQNITVKANGDAVYSENFRRQRLHKHVQSSNGDWSLIPVPAGAAPPCQGDCSEPSFTMPLFDELTPDRSWDATFGGMWGSSAQSRIYTSNNQLVLSKTSDIDGGSHWATTKSVAWLPQTGWGTDRPKMRLQNGIEYRLEIELSGKSLTDTGYLEIFFDADPAIVFYPYWADGKPRMIKNACAGEEHCCEPILNSDTDRINAAIQNLSDLSKRYNIPFLVNEFGVPARVEVPDQIKYFDAIIGAVQEKNLSGWGLHQYREPFANYPLGQDHADMITLGLFSGWGAPVSTFSGDQLSENFGTSPFWWREEFLRHISDELGGALPSLPFTRPKAGIPCATSNNGRIFPISGDWTSQGQDGAGLFQGGVFYLDMDSDGFTDEVVAFGRNTDLPVAGDFNGDGFDDIGVFRSAERRFFIDLNLDGLADDSITIGRSDDLPVVGDWDNDGADDLGVFRPSARRYYMDFNEDGIHDRAVTIGKLGDYSLVGDWDGDGVDSIGVFRPSFARFYLDDDDDGVHDLAQYFGRSTDIPVIGDWDGDGDDDIGVYRPSTNIFYLDNDGTTTSFQLLCTDE